MWDPRGNTERKKNSIHFIEPHVVFRLSFGRILVKSFPSCIFNKSIEMQTLINKLSKQAVPQTQPL